MAKELCFNLRPQSSTDDTTELRGEGATIAMIRELSQTLASRLRQIRLECYGPHGIATLATALGIPEGTWSNYERGVTLPAHTVLALIEETGVNPRWLLTGQGERYSAKRCEDQSRRAEEP
jgi:hypothetical protein